MTGQLDVAREGHLGIIALNRPEAINALSLEMVEGIRRTLEQWRTDDDVRLVLFEGNGARGFCSGGDVRAARAAVLAGRPQDADRFFAAEYAMNGVIATYSKPTVALGHGIVMGGGIGIAGHCRYRFASAESRFAMPEAAIGFVCDVGVNFILGKAPAHRALAFLMSGVAVGPADAMALGLADCTLDPARRDAVRAGVAAAASAANIDHALVQLMQLEMVPTPEPLLCQAADRLEAADWKSPGAICAAAADDPVLGPIARRSPTSLVAIFASYRRARSLTTIADVLTLDLALATWLSRQPDFAEGVRAVLVDKDQAPTWQPAEVQAVRHEQIDAVVASAEAAQVAAI